MADSKRFKALVDALHNLIQQYNLDLELHRQPISDSILPSQVSEYSHVLSDKFTLMFGSSTKWQQRAFIFIKCI